MMNSSIDLTLLERRLSELVVSVRQTDSDQDWRDVESTAQEIGNGLRVRDGLVDNHTILGKTGLPQSLTSLFTLALHGSAVPSSDYTAAIFELLRVAANLCMDHDENRAHLLEAGLPQALVSLLEGYVESIPPPPHNEPLTLSISHLKVVRTAIGVLLNASLGYDPVKFRLISLEAAMTILKLSTAIYPPGVWANISLEYDEGSPDSLEEAWTLRSGLSNWAWRTISELKDVKDETLQVFNPDVLPFITPPLLAFSFPYSPNSTLFSPASPIFNTLLHADFESLEESCMLVESLSLDVEDVRLSLARGFQFPAEHGGVPCLSIMLDFVENGTYPPMWNTSAFSEAERNRKEKAFDICKAALIKSIVEVAGEESNETVLWDDSEEDKPGGDFVCRMVKWIKQYVADMNKVSTDNDFIKLPATAREDLVICASLSLGNLARRERNTTALLSPPHSLAPTLASTHLLSPSTDIKLKHGVLGLLKHLAQSYSQSHVVDTALGDARIVQRVSECGIWDEKADAMAEIVQLGAIGVVKHMCNASVEHAFALVLPSSNKSPTGLSQLLALVKRSDSVPVKSEGTRVLVNVIKSLWSNEGTTSPTSVGSFSNGILDSEKAQRRQVSMQAILTPECAFALASLVGRSGKYPLLVNEGVVALSLLSTQGGSGPLVLNAITTPLVLDAASPAEPSSESTSTSSDISSPVVTTPSSRSRLPVPRHALDMLVAVLRNVDNPANFPVEVRLNVCSLFMQIGRQASGEEFTKVKDMVRPVLEKVLDTMRGTSEKEGLLKKAMKRVLDSWV